jgi:hypothetical protein
MDARTFKARAAGVLAGLVLVLAPGQAAHAQGPPVPPVAAPISADPAGPVRGTMLLVHGGAWAGHSALAQQLLMTDPGPLFVARGWRVISIDMAEGKAGLQAVLTAVDAELARPARAGPLCIYGESSGAHLSLVAARRRRAVDCVLGMAAPTDLAQLRVVGNASPDPRVRAVTELMERFFGTTAAELDPWSPRLFAPSIHADVLLLHEVDDPLIPAAHGRRFQAAVPTTQLVELEPGDPATKFRHGSISALGRTHYEAALKGFADQALARRDAERRAAAVKCSASSSRLRDVGLARVQRALRCLARRDAALPSAAAGWRRTTITVQGAVNAARVWARLRESAAGRRSLANLALARASLSVRLGPRSRVSLSSVAAAR